MNDKQKSSYVLSLRDIAAWQFDASPDKKPEIVAAIPALQRGLVWKPKQIELLWDSLLRGIPVGSFVICRKIEAQVRGGLLSDHITHHLLDGQQRANAIYLGFAAFPSSDEAILWIDLNPDPERKLLRNSTRNFLLRLTTKAHPWGYTREDMEGRLPAYQIRDSIIKYLEIASPTEKRRPYPAEMRPYQANVPVPLSLLLHANETEDSSCADFWSSIISALSVYNNKWAKAAQMYLSGAIVDDLDKKYSDLRRIHAGVQQALSSKLIALNAPSELLEASLLETAQPIENTHDGITNIEHLFQRLNQQGTRLDGEELAYSLIKAYWPEIVDDIDKCAETRMPGSRLATLAFRCVLSNGEDALRSPINVSFIRRLSKECDDTTRKQVIAFIRHDLAAACHLVDRWLGVNPDFNCEWGLLPVHRTAIAINAPEIYLLLLWLAWRYPTTNETLFPRITAMASLGSWFGTDQGKFANTLFKHTHEALTDVTLKTAMADCSAFHKPIFSPEELHQLLALPTPDAVMTNKQLLSHWDWNSLFLNTPALWPNDSEAVRKQRFDKWWPSLWAIMVLKHAGQHLLLYAQRTYLRSDLRFKDYDPARRDLWESHNRPWDFDHILPHYYTYYQQGPFRELCAKWIGLIGNLRAWPFEENRSDQKDVAGSKIRTTNDISNSFLTQELLERFTQSDDVRQDPMKALAFVTACRDRIVGIYREWYETLDIHTLLSQAENGDA